MQTLRLFPSDITEIAEILATGGVVALPTETVYGLAADAASDAAVAKIFAAKQRPATNPLIVHIASIRLLQTFARIDHQWVWDCMEKFSPGPISYVLPYTGGLAATVNAGMSTVAVRFPLHDTFQAVLRESNLALAAPSANVSGHPSATTWKAVLSDLDGRIDAVVCDEPCRWGVESTVIDATTETPIILRPGAITLEQLQSVAPNIQASTSRGELNERSPGTRFKHYQPKARVHVVDEMEQFLEAAGHARIALIGIDTAALTQPKNVYLVERCADVTQYAQRLYQFFREADANQCELILCQRVDRVGMGVALMDRLDRASADAT